MDGDHGKPSHGEANNGKEGYFNVAFEHCNGDNETIPRRLGGLAASAETGQVSAGKDGSPNKDEADEGPEREKWGNPIEFLLSCVAMSVGLGNIWRFPYTAYKNGGGAFLIPYLIVLTFIGRPIYFLELALGQFSSYGQTKVWKAAPFFKGIGYGAMIGTACVVSYYASIMGLTVFYFFASFQAQLPWSVCNSEILGEYADKLYCWENDTANLYDMLTMNKSNISVPQIYFENEVLRQKTQIEDGIGLPEWRLTLCLIFSWLLIWGSLVRGVSSAGKVAYFTALFPYFVLTIMMIRGATLPNAWEGIKFFIKPQWEKMLHADVWFAAVGQCFFSLSTGFGPIIMFASYNDFSHNIYRDAWIISGLDTFTSLFAGFTVFAVLGNLAGELGVEVEAVAKGGPGLAFISFAQGLSKFTWAPQLFSVLFYMMLFTLGVGSANSLTGGIITLWCDQFPSVPRWKMTTIVSLVLFLTGLIYVTPGGQFMLELVDHFGANFLIYVMATLEVMAIAWVYGLQNFLDDIEFMLKIKVGWYWKFCWGFFVPVGLAGILVYALATEKRLTYDGLPFPDIALACGWILAILALLTLPAFAIHAVWTRKSSGLWNKLKESFRPTADWGPRKTWRRNDWKAFKQAKSSY